MDLAVVASHGDVAKARATVGSALEPRGGQPSNLRVTVLATCHCYRRVNDESVLTPQDLGITSGALADTAATHTAPDLQRWLLARLVRELVASRREVLAVRPGVEVLTGLPASLVTGSPLRLVAQTGALARVGGHRRDDGVTIHDPDVLVMSSDARVAAEKWCDLTDHWRTGARSVDLLGGLIPHETSRDTALLLSTHTVTDDLAAATGQPGGHAPALLDLSHADADRPWLLDADVEDPVLLLSASPLLAGLVQSRLAARRADILAQDSDHDGPFVKTSLGSSYGPAIRELVRAAVDSARPPAGPGVPNPFDDAEAATLREWLMERVPLGDALGVARYLWSIRSTRPDLQSAFPSVPGRDSEAFLAWARLHGITEHDYDDAGLLSEAVDRSQPPKVGRAPRRRGRGVNLVGYLTGELGIGESARLVRSALAAAAVPVATRAVATQLVSRQDIEAAEPEQSLDYDTTILCVNAAQTHAVTAASGLGWSGSHRVGYWYWEVEAFPAAEHPAFALVDEIWVATDFVNQAIRPHSPVPVVTMTPPLWREHGLSTLPRSLLGLPEDRQVVLFAFDYLSTAERKNPWGVVEAFRQAFPRGRRGQDGPILVLKSINAHRKPRDAERLRLLVADDPDILQLEHYLSPAELHGLMSACDVYLSLHRSEGLGLTMAEAMSMGKPVIATGYSGNLQFMDETNSYLVPWVSVPIPEHCEPYPPGTPWADPDLSAAADALRSVLANPQQSALVGRRAADTIRELHSPSAAGERMRRQLERGRRSRRRRFLGR